MDKIINSINLRNTGLLILTSLIFVFCNSTYKNKTEKKDSSLIERIKIDKSSNGFYKLQDKKTPVIVTDEAFIYDVLYGDPVVDKAVEYFNGDSYKIKTNPNRYLPNLIDSIFTFFSETDTFQYHKSSGDKKILLKLILSSKLIPLTNTVKLNTSKIYFINKYGLNSELEYLKIVNIDGGVEFDLFFENEILREIRFEIPPLVQAEK